MALTTEPSQDTPDAVIALRNLPPGATGCVDRLRLLQKAGRGHGGIVVMCGDTHLALGCRETDGILILPDPTTPETR